MAICRDKPTTWVLRDSPRDPIRNPTFTAVPVLIVRAAEENTDYIRNTPVESVTFVQPRERRCIHHYSTMNMRSECAYTALVQDPAQEVVGMQRSETKSICMMQWGGYCDTIQGNVVECVHNNVGLLLVMLSQVFISFMNVTVKVLNQLESPVPVLELVMAITFVCCEIFMIAAKIPDPFLGPKEVRPLLVCRGVAGFFALFGTYYALQYLSLGDVAALTFAGPIFTGIAGRLFLGETYSKREAFASFCSLFGVILIARPPFLFESARDPDLKGPVVNASSGDRLRAALVLMMGVLMATLAMIAIRAIGTRAHAMHSMAYFSLWCVMVSTIGSFLSGEPIVCPTQWQWGVLLLLIGVSGFIAQMCLTIGLQRETAARGMMGIYVQVIFADILDVSFFRTVPSLLSFLGTGIIMTCAIYIVLTKQKQRQEPKVTLESGESTAEEGLLVRGDSVSEE
ncbi:hypothetical protein EDC04DRAFT_2999665 [Pisolithus marmoratus]|nr:hypothetical protein EDC04DRAFT_2999665 [Pisolithus marmoratus]